MRKHILGLLLITTLLSLTLFMQPLTDLFSKESGKITLNKTITNPIINNFSTKYLLIYFGYVGCKYVCTPRLTELSNIYKNYQGKNLDVIFIDLGKTRDPQQGKLFAQYFNKNFYGLNLEKNTLESLKKEFQIYSAVINKEEDISHSSYLYLLQKQNTTYTLKNIYTSVPFSKELILKDLHGTL